MTIPLQRETLLRLFQENADEQGRVRMTVHEIFERTGIPLHDVAKTAWGLQKEQKLRFKESKRSTQGGRTKSSLHDFELLPSAWTEDMRAQQASRKLHSRDQFEALVASMSKPKSAPAQTLLTAEDSTPENYGWGRVRVTTGSIRKGELISLDNGRGKAMIRDVSGHVRWGTLVDRYDQRPDNWPTEKRRKGGPKTFVSKTSTATPSPKPVVPLRDANDLGWAKISIGNGMTARGKLDRINGEGKARILDAAGRERYGTIIDRYSTRPLDWPTKRQIHKPAFKPATLPAVTPVAPTGIAISRSDFPLLAQLMERDDHLLAAADSLKKAGLDQEADRILTVDLAHSLSPLERELDRLLRSLKVSITA